jgi:predicted metal-binding membrane protein
MSSMSMPWTRMPGETWLAATVSFLAMWLLMMAAMMLPSLAPILMRYRRAELTRGERQATAHTALFGTGYFVVWSALGLAIFPTGVAISSLVARRPMLAHSAPTLVGVVVLLAGALQFNAWKERQLECSRELPSVPAHRVRTALAASWRDGLGLGLHCSYCCIGMTAVLLATGLMELRSMVLVTAAITVERTAPSARTTARLIGAIFVAAGLFLIARAVG